MLHGLLQVRVADALLLPVLLLTSLGEQGVLILLLVGQLPQRTAPPPDGGPQNMPTPWSSSPTLVGGALSMSTHDRYRGLAAREVVAIAPERTPVCVLDSV